MLGHRRGREVLFCLPHSASESSSTPVLICHPSWQTLTWCSVLEEEQRRSLGEGRHGNFVTPLVVIQSHARPPTFNGIPLCLGELHLCPKTPRKSLWGSTSIPGQISDIRRLLQQTTTLETRTVFRACPSCTWSPPLSQQRSVLQ